MSPIGPCAAALAVPLLFLGGVAHANTPFSEPHAMVVEEGVRGTVELFPTEVTELGSKAPPALQAPSVDKPSPWWTPLMRYTGIAVGGVGLATVGVGAYFGQQAESRRSSTKREAGLSQQESQRRYEQADTAAKRANLFFAVGGGVVALGVALLGFDLIAAPSPDVQTIVVSGPKKCERDQDCTSGETCQNGVCRLPPVVVEKAAQTFVIQGVVADKATGEPIPDASIYIGNAVSPITVNSKTGEFKSWALPAGGGLVELRVQAPGYRDGKEVVPSGGGGEVKKLAIGLESTNRPVTGEIRGKATNAKTGRQVRAEVFIPALNIKVRASKTGEFSMTVTPGEYDVLISAKGLSTQKKRLKVRPGDVVILNVDMSGAQE